MEPVQKEVEAANKTGQGLIQTSAPGVSTAVLEGDLEGLNDKWSYLNQQVNN